MKYNHEYVTNDEILTTLKNEITPNLEDLNYAEMVDGIKAGTITQQDIETWVNNARLVAITL